MTLYSNPWKNPQDKLAGIRQKIGQMHNCGPDYQVISQCSLKFCGGSAFVCGITPILYTLLTFHCERPDYLLAWSMRQWQNGAWLLGRYE